MTDDAGRNGRDGEQRRCLAAVARDQVRVGDVGQLQDGAVVNELFLETVGDAGYARPVGQVRVHHLSAVADEVLCELTSAPTPPHARPLN